MAAADTLRAARAQLVRQLPDVLLTDLELPDGNGMELIGDLDRAAETEIIVVTGHASVGTAVEALRVGATDYLTKPIEVERLTNMLRRQPRTVDLKHEIGELRDELRKAGRFGHLLRIVAADAGAVRQDSARRADVGHGVVDRRKRYRQGTGGAHYSRLIQTQACAVFGDQLRRDISAIDR